jgi:hypothetical protein
MTDAKEVEQGILRAVGKLVVIILLLGVIVAVGYGVYTNTEAYQDRKAQEKMLNDLRGVR